VGWSVLSVDFSPDQKWFLYSTWSPYIHVCNVYEEEERHYSLDLSPEYDNQFNFCAFAATFSNDNREILASANDGNLYIYDRERQEKTLTIDAHQDDACAVTFADDSTPFIIYSAGDDGVCKVWDRRSLHEASPRPVGIFAGHKDGITYIDSKGDGRYLITNCKDQTIKLWDTRVFANNDGIQATLDSVSKQRWDYRWQNVPKYGNIIMDVLVVITYNMRDSHSIRQLLQL
jgi:WD repeat-containing protein 23